MQSKTFYSLLSLVTLFSFGLQFGLIYFSKNDLGNFPYWGLIFFILFSILIFHLGLNSAKHPDRNRFTGIIMSMIFLKLVCTLGLVLWYDRMILPLNIQHIISFLISYLVYTVFEVYFMTKLARWHA